MPYTSFRYLAFAIVLIAIAAIGAIAAPTTGPATQPAKTSEFLDQVRANFAQWDADHDGILSADEIEKAVDDPAVKGPAAAAAVSLRRAIRAHSDISPVTLQSLSASLNSRHDTKSPAPAFEAMYRSALTKIGRSRRELFVSDGPRVDTLAQGRLGDCFLIAPLGTIASRQPDRLKKMVTLLPDGQFEVHFGAGQTVTLPMPTDAEIAIGASTLNDGVWANVFEKAIGHIYLERQKTPRHVTPYSIIGVGGTPSSPLGLITGHTCKRWSCGDFQKGKLTPADRETRLNEMRTALSGAFAAGKLVVGGTAPIGAGETIVPGLYYNHSYGVLNYDRKTDLVTFWNPMGNAYTPHGDPSLTHGYATSHGRFDVPLPDAVMWFGSFSIETDEAIKQ